MTESSNRAFDRYWIFETMETGDILTNLRSISLVLIIVYDGAERVTVSEVKVQRGTRLILRSVFFVK